MKLDPEIYILATTLLFIGVGLIFDKWRRIYFWGASFFFSFGSHFFFTGLSIRGEPKEYISVKGGVIESTQAILVGILFGILSILILIMTSIRERNRFRKSSKKDESIKKIPDQNQSEETDFNDLYDEFEEKLKNRKDPEPNKPIRKIY